MGKEERSHSGRNGNRNRRRSKKKARIRGILMLIVLIIIVGVYVIVGNHLFSEKTPNGGQNAAEATQNLQENPAAAAGEAVKSSAGDAKQLREQLTEVRNMDLDGYTEETVNNLLDYIAAAQTLIAGNASQEKLDDISVKLAEAVDNLVPAN